ncbi:MAG: DEAD/DEAH box helicase [Thermotaleaceae bacterium]
MGVRLNNDSSMLEVSFEYQEMDPREMNDILAAYRSRKKYFRLGNGAFLSLTNTEFEKVADIIDYLELNDKDLSKKLIELPRYRAIYLDEILREAQLSSVHKNQAFKSLVQNIKEPQDMEFSLPKELDPILRDYQKTGFRWLKTLAEYGMGGILADDMGLGKTLQILAFICSEKEKKLGPSLVIAPTSLVYNWQDEAQKFVPSMKIVVISGDPKERHELLQEIDQADLIITSYPLIRRDIELYETVEFAYCILDEAQHIKNPSSLNAKTVKQIKAKGYYGLTGTPIENSLSEMWSIFDFVMPGYLLSHGKFVKKYEKPIIRDQNNKIMNQLVKQIRPFILRRLKKDVAKELPEKIETKVITELTEEQKKLYLPYLPQAKTTVDNEIYTHGFEKSQMKILALLTRLRQICCHPSLFLENYQGDSCKLLLLEDIVQDAKKSGHRILLFSQFTSMLDIIRRKLNGMGIEYFYLDGAVKAQDRRDMVSAFQQGNKDIFLISLKAGGTGLNLTGADMVIHFDPWWNPAVEEQATDRAYRIGQKNNVQVFKFITKGTIEEKIYELQKKKKSLIDSVIQPGETLISKMKEAEIRELFEL